MSINIVQKWRDRILEPNREIALRPDIDDLVMRDAVQGAVLRTPSIDLSHEVNFHNKCTLKVQGLSQILLSVLAARRGSHPDGPRCRDYDCILHSSTT